MIITLIDANLHRARKIWGQLALLGYEVDHVLNGRVGPQRLRRDCDAVLIASTLPDSCGIDIVRQLRGAGFTRPAVILHDSDGLSGVLEGFSSGADDVIRASTGAVEVAAKMSAILRRERNRVLTHGELYGFRFDAATLEVIRGRTRVRLACTEFRLLRLLAAASPAPLTASELRCAFASGRGSSPASLRMRVCSLRRTLQSSGLPMRIRTHHDYGYAIVAGRAAAPSVIDAQPRTALDRGPSVCGIGNRANHV